jgi:hypothetical protein
MLVLEKRKAVNQAGHTVSDDGASPSLTAVMEKARDALPGDAFRHSTGGISGYLQIGFTFAATNDLNDGGCRFRVRTSVLVLVGLCKQLE